MRRLLEVQAVVEELLSMDESALANCSQLDDFADDILKKLSHIRTSVHASSPSSPAWSSPCVSPSFDSSPSSPSLSPSNTLSSTLAKNTRRKLRRRRSRPISPPGTSNSSAASSTSTDSFWSSASGSSSSSEYTLPAAQAAFDAHIYARSVRIVERLARAEKNNLDKTAIRLAHESYSHMVHDADTEEDALKLAHYWIDFVDGVFDPHSAPVHQLEALAHREEALFALFQLDDELREQTAVRRLLVSMDAYKVSLLVYRPFHLAALRRLQVLVETMNEVESILQDSAEYAEAEEMYAKAARKSWRDRIKYDEETDGHGKKRCSTDTDAVVGVEMLQQMQQLRPIESAPRSRAQSADDVDDIVEKVFAEEMVYRL